MKRRLIACLGLGAVAVGCQGGFLGLGDPNADFLTDRAQYTLRATSGGLEVSIPFTFTNRTGRRIHVLNCLGIAPPHLERWVADRWVFAWGMATPDCVSVPIPIPAGATYADTLPVFHGGGNVLPQFSVQPLDGTYRLVWEAVRWSEDGSLFAIGDTLPLSLRASNTFSIQSSS
jgi:hypothetical protein